MKKTLSTIGYICAMLILLDAFILFIGLGQITFENKNDYWPPFWKVQAKFIVNLLQ